MVLSRSLSSSNILKNRMGTETCRTASHEFQSPAQANERNKKEGVLEQLADFNNAETNELEDQPPSPLKKFITAHSTGKSKGASHGLPFQSQIVSDGPRKVRIDSSKIVQPNQSENSKKIVKPKCRPSITSKLPFVAAEPIDINQFQDTLKQFVVTEKNFGDSFGRIEISQEKFITLRKEDIRKHYKFDDRIGEGAFGSVYKAFCLKSKEVRAVKIIKKENLIKGKKDQVFSQLQLLKKMDHPNIIKLYEVFQWEHKYQVVMEYCNGGSIIDFIKSRSHYDEDNVKVILKQLLGCLNYLKTIKIVHRDLKLENVVFINKLKQRMSNDEIEIKLLDFGTAAKITKSKVKCPDLVGTVSYMPPQIIKGFFTQKCDLWSCGVIFFILLTSKSPFRCSKRQNTLQKILTHEIRFTESIWSKVSAEAKDLLLKLLEKDPFKRISANEALNHPWFQKDVQNGEQLASTSFLNSLSNYYRQNNLISVLQTYLVFSKVSQDEQKKINNIFKKLDKNLDGFIERQQLIQAFIDEAGEDYSLDQIEFIISKIDKDQSGLISLNEFTTVMVDKSKLWAKGTLQEAFDYFDTDKTGFIERNELAELLAGSDNAQIQSLIQELDSDKDQRISKQQFISYLLRQGCLQ